MDSLPLWWATAATVVLFLLIAIGVWSVRREAVYTEAPDQARWRDFRIWATLLVIVQLCIYLVFS